MKNAKKIPFVFVLLAGLIITLSQCRQDDTILVADDQPLGPNVLLAQKITTAPTIDGVVDGLWENSRRLEFETVVADPSGDVFRGFVGNNIPYVSLRAAYDSDNIYLIAEWEDPTQSLQREPWYFDPTTKLWKQEAAAPIFSAPTRPGFYEDKLALLWNVNNSVSGWNTGTCYKSCHMNLSAADGYARHHTNNATERIDTWHWKSVRAGIDPGQFDDQYQDNTYPNGRKSDSGAGAYADNKQSLVVTGSSPEVTVTVPKYIIPGRTNYYWILGSEISAGTAQLVTAVDANGILTLGDATFVDPNTDLAYQRSGNGVGNKVVPGVTITSYTGSRDDIQCQAVFTGTGWVLEFKRALNTGDTENKDVDFSNLEDQYFGFAIFENAQIAHSIKTNLLLKFDK